MRAYAMQIEILNFIELLDLGLLELVTCELQIRPELGLIPSIAELELSFSKLNLNSSRVLSFLVALLRDKGKRNAQQVGRYKSSSCDVFYFFSYISLFYTHILFLI